jgi:hypothetical protein
VPRVVQQSIAMIHAGGGDAWADETTFHAIESDGVAASAIAAVRAMETAIVESDLDWLVLRGGLFYGPAQEGLDYVSLVHIADMAAATVAAIARWPSRQALIVADDEPARWRDVLGYVCSLAGSHPPEPGGRALMPSFRVRNRRAREALAWAPVYPDYRSGLVR